MECKSFANLMIRKEESMLKVLYEDQDILVAVKPQGVESQSARKFAPDMVSEVKKYLVINKKCTPGKEPYVGVIHRLDKPVSGIMVYAKTKNAASKLSSQLQKGNFDKKYQAVVCGKVEKPVDNFVDYLKKSVDENYSQVVDKGITDAKRAELSYELLGEKETEQGILSLLSIHLMTGRHHQIRVQFSSHGLPLFGDKKYNEHAEGQNQLALCAVSLSFTHPVTGKKMEFSMKPQGGAFNYFN